MLTRKSPAQKGNMLDPGWLWRTIPEPVQGHEHQISWDEVNGLFSFLICVRRFFWDDQSKSNQLRSMMVFLWFLRWEHQLTLPDSGSRRPSKVQPIRFQRAACGKPEGQTSSEENSKIPSLWLINWHYKVTQLAMVTQLISTYINQ